MWSTANLRLKNQWTKYVKYQKTKGEAREEHAWLKIKDRFKIKNYTCNFEVLTIFQKWLARLVES